MSYVPYHKAIVEARVVDEDKEYNEIFYMEFEIVLHCDLSACRPAALKRAMAFLSHHNVVGRVRVKITEGLFTYEDYITLRNVRKEKWAEKKGREQEPVHIELDEY